VNIRPSMLIAADRCSRAMKFQYIDRIRTESVSSALVFGTAIDLAIKGYIENAEIGLTYDSVDAFRSNWNEQKLKKGITFPTTHTPESMEEIGIRLMEKFPDYWEKSDMHPLYVNDKPIFSIRLEKEITDGIMLTGEPDFVGYNSQYELTILDFKTCAQPNKDVFIRQADQLTAYQDLVEANKDLLEIPSDQSVVNVGYIDLVKRKIPKAKGKGPEIEPIKVVSARSLSELEEFEEKVLWLNEDMIRGKFPRKSGLSFDSPCNMCDFDEYCLNGDTEGLIFPEDLD
jgi:hypothetical protein